MTLAMQFLLFIMGKISWPIIRCVLVCMRLEFLPSIQPHYDNKNLVWRHHQGTSDVSGASSRFISINLVTGKSLQLTISGGHGCTVKIYLGEEVVYSRWTITSGQASFASRVSISLIFISCCAATAAYCIYCARLRLRGMVVLKGRRPVGATDDYDTDDDAANDDMTDQQSVVTATTVKTSMTSLSSSVSSPYVLLSVVWRSWHCFMEQSFAHGMKA